MRKITILLLMLTCCVGIMYSQAWNYLIDSETQQTQKFDSSTTLPPQWFDLSDPPNPTPVVSGIGINGTNAVRGKVSNTQDFILATPRITNCPPGAYFEFGIRFMQPGSTSQAGSLGNMDRALWLFITEDEGTINSWEEVAVICSDNWRPTTAYDYPGFRVDDLDMDRPLAGRSFRWLFYGLLYDGASGGFDVHIDNLGMAYQTTSGNDLRISAIVGAYQPRENFEYPYTVSVQNIGGLDVSGGYTVSLKAGGATVGAPQQGYQLARNQTATYNFNYVPPALNWPDPLPSPFYPPTVSISGVVDFSDTNQANNTMSMTVTPFPADNIYCGDFNSEDGFIVSPFCLYYQESLTQSLYYAYEMGPAGSITEIWYAFMRSNIEYPTGPIPVKVWMANTNKAMFNSKTDALPYGNFTLVYSGNINLSAAGMQDVGITLSSPFYYSGGNLIVMTQRVHGDYYDDEEGNIWLITETPGKMRTLSYYNDDALIGNLESGYPTFEDAESYVANIQMIIGGGGDGPTPPGNNYTVSGTVKTDTSVSIEGAFVELIDLDTMGSTLAVTTNALGAYSITAPGGKYYYVSTYGYSPLTVPNDFTMILPDTVLLDRNITGKNFIIPTGGSGPSDFTVSGKVFFSTGGSSTTVPDAHVWLVNTQGQSSPLATTSADGSYTIVTTAGLYTVRAEGFAGGQVREGQHPSPVTVSSNLTNIDITFTAASQPMVTLSGYVVIESYYDPIPNATVNFTPVGGGATITTTSTPTGSFTVQVPQGQLNWTAVANYYGVIWNCRSTEPVTAPASGVYITIGPASDGDHTGLPTLTTLRANYPNPFNPTTTISFDINREGNVLLEVFNVKGQRVKTLADRVYGIGQHKVVWNGDDEMGNSVSSGMYFYRMTTDDFNGVKRMMLMK